MKHLIFRADGNSKTGLGHLYRVFALFEMYKMKHLCFLFTRETTTLSVIPSDFDHKTIPSNISIEEEPDWFYSKFAGGKYTIIADGYSFDTAYQKKLKEFKFNVLLVDDLCNWHMYADVVVNHAPLAKADVYKTERYTRLALGTKYAILRPAFLEAAKQKRHIHSIDTAFVCFGGADENDISYKAVSALLQFTQIKKINVVLGAAYKHNNIENIQGQGITIELHRNLNETQLATVMKESNFGITSASTILYELCSVKMPILAGYYVDNQSEIYGGCVEKGVIFEGGNFANSSEGEFADMIQRVLQVKNYDSYLKAQANMFDGHIQERFLDLLQTVTYRKAEEADMLTVYKWANDKVSRANSYFSESIALDTHKAWFEKKLKDLASLILIAEVDGEAAGMLRYDILSENAVVGILVDAAYRGKGLAPRFLTETAKLFFEKQQLTVFAYIKQENTASIKTFERAGYKKLRNERVHGCESYVYKLEKNDV